MLKNKFKINIDGHFYSVKRGETILAVCRRYGIFIPTLCHHPDLPVQAKCRVCLVEVSGRGLVTSCSTRVEEGMEIKTVSRNVERARAVNLEMIYAEHVEKCGDCLYEQNCRLKAYAENYGLQITRYSDRKKNRLLWHFGVKPQSWLQKRVKMIQSQFSGTDKDFRLKQAKLHADGYIAFDASKCIDCGLCSEVCGQHQTCNFYRLKGKGADTLTCPTDNPQHDCVYCGQCVVHCPVGAIHGVAHWPQVEELLKNKRLHKKKLIAQIAPSIRVSIGEEFGLEYGSVVTGQLVAAIHNLNFDVAFDVSAGADFTTYEEALELIRWLSTDKPRPMFTSCCPAWVKFVEFYYPEFTNHLTTTRSPHLHAGILAKTYWADLMGYSPQDIMVVSIMPCTAKKQEISLTRHYFDFYDRATKQKFNLPIVDYVLTTREFAYLLRRYKIDLGNLKAEKIDTPLGSASGAGVIYGASGGVMESALRTADYFLRVKQETGSLDKIIHGRAHRLKKRAYSKISQSRIEFKKVRGQQGVKSARVTVGAHNLKVAIVNGLGNARNLLEDLKAGRCDYDYVEVMACPGGCIGGGGQPLPTDAEIRAKRAAALYQIDQQKDIRAAHRNPAVRRVYRQYFKGNRRLIEDLMHCRYYPLEKRGGYQQIN